MDETRNETRIEFTHHLLVLAKPDSGPILALLSFNREPDRILSLLQAQVLPRRVILTGVVAEVAVGWVLPLRTAFVLEGRNASGRRRLCFFCKVNLQ